MSEPQDESVWTPIAAHDNPDPFAYLAPEFRGTLSQWRADIRSMGRAEAGGIP